MGTREVEDGEVRNRECGVVGRGKRKKVAGEVGTPKDVEGGRGGGDGIDEKEVGRLLNMARKVTIIYIKIYLYL